MTMLEGMRRALKKEFELGLQCRQVGRPVQVPAERIRQLGHVIAEQFAREIPRLLGDDKNPGQGGQNHHQDVDRKELTTQAGEP